MANAHPSAPPHPGDARFDASVSKVYLVGGGIASMAAAAFMIRDGDVPGAHITILEESQILGGSLDGSGSAETGYVLRGGRMLESKYVCTFDLFASIPTLDDSRTVTEETFSWNETMKTSSKARLVRDGRRQTAPRFGLEERHILGIERLGIEPEGLLGRTTIADKFDPSFFETDFWFMWCTTFAFQPWHSAVEFKRYLVRFAHMVSGFNRLEGIMRTTFNQYDSLVRPLQRWLEQRGVVFELGARVVDLGIRDDPASFTVDRILLQQNGGPREILVAPGDKVMVTLGSMTEGSSLGSMDAPPKLLGKADGGAWILWETLARDRPAFGRPAAFDDDIGHSRWVSFTTTLNSPAFLRLVADFTGNVPGEGGLITFPNSPWLASIVIPHQPHFIGQPQGVDVLWGYGLKVDEPGEFVNKPMAACNGREIMTEIIGQLRMQSDAALILDHAICIPCMMPFITSQFMPRAKGDRPQVVPEGSSNLAFMGQFCELPDDVVFTVEYSVRSAQAGVYELLGLRREPAPVYKGEMDPRVLYKAFLALHDLAA